MFWEIIADQECNFNTQRKYGVKMQNNNNNNNIYECYFS